METKIPKARVALSRYRYGKITKRLRDAAQWINSNNKLIRSSELEFFLPASIYNKLSPDEADFLEEETHDRRQHFWEHPELSEVEESGPSPQLNRYNSGRIVWKAFQKALGSLDNSMGTFNHLIGRFIYESGNYDEKKFIKVIKSYVKDC